MQLRHIQLFVGNNDRCIITVRMMKFFHIEKFHTHFRSFLHISARLGDLLVNEKGYSLPGDNRCIYRFEFFKRLDSQIQFD